MARSMRFGRRLPLPSTRQIMHELRVFSVHEDARKAKIGQEALPRVSTGIEPDEHGSDHSMLPLGDDH